MKIKTDLSEKEPDETKFPHLRIDYDEYVYIFYSTNVSFNLSCSDMAVRCSPFGRTEYFTGSITLSND